MKRKAITKDEKLAAALLLIDQLRCEIDPTLQACIDREKAKLVEAKDMERVMDIEWDHYPIPVAWGGTNHPTNLVPMRKAEHRHKTSKKDVPAIAKTKRILKKHQPPPIPAYFEEIEQAVDQINARKEKKAKWGSRHMPGTKASGIKKSLRGRVTSRS